jgi:lysophospholipase L1-like esterase
MSTRIEPNATVLFQGDSITDASRSRTDPNDMGTGYAMMASSWFSAQHPDRRVSFLNRGISGNRARDLVSRWKEDCLDLNPTWLSIMIGVNDTWRRFDRNEPTPTEAYEESYRTILTQARDRLKCRFILIEPFLLPHPEDRKAWRPDLDPRIGVVNRLAQEFDAILVPMDKIFAEAARKREAPFWAGDGVHPSKAGHALIAQSWLKAVSA